jgi:hypothetical protein
MVDEEAIDVSDGLQGRGDKGRLASPESCDRVTGRNIRRTVLQDMDARGCGWSDPWQLGKAA